MVESFLLPLVASASLLTMPTPAVSGTHTVQFFDRARNVTNRVLDRSIYVDVARVHTNRTNFEFHFRRAQRNAEAVQEHCRRRLRAAGLQQMELECGVGYRR